MLGLPGPLKARDDAQPPLASRAQLKVVLEVSGKAEGAGAGFFEVVGLEESLLPVGLPCGPCRHSCSPLGVSVWLTASDLHRPLGCRVQQVVRGSSFRANKCVQ